MTDKQVMQQALDELERAAINAEGDWSKQRDWDALADARLAVYAAIAQPEQPIVAAQAGQSEPVAWGDLARHNGYLTRSKSDAELYNENCFTLTPLYTEPAPVRHPLTRMEIQTIVIEVCDTIYPQDDTSYSEADSVFYGAFARAIEAKINAQGPHMTDTTMRREFEAGQSAPEKQAAEQQELIAILREAADIINAIDPTHAPANIRWPIVDELDGFSLIVAHPAPVAYMVDTTLSSNAIITPVFDYPTPVRQPLTPKQIEKAYQLVWSTVPHAKRLTAFARAIEAKINEKGGA